MSIPFTVQELADYLFEEGLLKSPKVSNEALITGFSSITESRQGTLSWSNSSDLDWEKVESSVVILPDNTGLPDAPGIIFIPVPDPRLAFIKVMNRVLPDIWSQGICSTVIIGKDCSIAESVSIGHYSVIGNNVTIGARCLIYPNVTIYDNVSIGVDCIIHSGTVIGTDGFGFARDGDLVIKFPHIGGVTIEDNVEIGSNTSIDRGTLSDTIIESNVKIDNLCHIAHNVVIEDGSYVIACSMIGGSVKLKKGSYIAPGAVIRDGLVIGENALVGLGAVVVKDVESGDIVAGVPAKSVKSK